MQEHRTEEGGDVEEEEEEGKEERKGVIGGRHPLRCGC